MSDIKKVSFSNLESLYNSRIKPIVKTLPEISHVADKIIWQAYPPEGHGDAQGALAYVTTADDNGNGQIDSLRFNVNNIMQDLRGKNVDVNNLSDSDLRYLVETITHTIGHEEGHRRGYNPEEKTMPGEQEADAYGDRALETLRSRNIDIAASKTISLQKEFIKLANRYDQGNESKQADALDEAVKYLNNNNSTKDLVRLANNLDRLNLTKEADLIDNILKKAFFGLSPMAFFVGCQGKGGLKHKHFAWAATSDGNFISTWEDADQKTYEMTADNGKKFFVVEIHNLDSMSEDSYFQNTKNVYSYDQIQDGKVYDDLENFENGDYSFLKEEDKYDGTPSPFTLYFELFEGGLTGGKMQTFPKTSPQ